MISGIDLTQTVDYILKTDTDNPTVFKLGIIPARILAKLSEMKDQIDMAYTLMQIGIKGWQNFNNVEFKTITDTRFGVEISVVPLELINRLPLTAIAELSTKIIEINKLGDTERKN